MSYDEKLANRVRRVLSGRADLDEKRMFGGLAFMVGGHMCCGIVGRDLMVRVGAKNHAEALDRPHAREMNFTGRPSKGMVYVAPAGLRSGPSLRRWTDRALSHVATLPQKPLRKPVVRPRGRSVSR
jgi:TfoX/Sxy family transcriptional regulator of competence genes